MTATQITSQIQAMIDEQTRSVTTLLVDGADRMVSDAERLIPVRTGATKAALTVDVKNRTDGIEITIHTGSQDDVAFDQEYGTTTNDAQPFMRPAFDQTIDQLRDTVVAAARDITKKYNDKK